MTEKTFKIIELCGVSENSYAEATKNAVAKASETLRNLDWFEVSTKGASSGTARLQSSRSC